MTMALKSQVVPMKRRRFRGGNESVAAGEPPQDEGSPSFIQPLPEEEVLKSAKESLRVYRTLVARAADVFGDEIIAVRWLSTPNPDFSGEQPLEAARKAGMSDDTIENLFEPVFVRMEEGIYW